MLIYIAQCPAKKTVHTVYRYTMQHVIHNDNLKQNWMFGLRCARINFEIRCLIIKSKIVVFRRHYFLFNNSHPSNRRLCWEHVRQQINENTQTIEEKLRVLTRQKSKKFGKVTKNGKNLGACREFLKIFKWLEIKKSREKQK